jgi:hypothetical protein
MLARRTEKFVRVPRTVKKIEDFQKRIEGWTPPKRPFPDFYHCPFLGLIGSNGRRVGCLLHPAASGNKGTDWRGLSYYGGMACRTYLCPTARHLPATYLRILRQTMDHWYPFGLIVTEHRLLAAFFGEVENRIGRSVETVDFTKSSRAAAIFREFVGLKITWPYRRKDAPGPCNYFFENGEYPRPPVQRLEGEIPLSRYEDLFRELDSAFSEDQELFEAEERLNHFFGRLEKAILKTWVRPNRYTNG